MGNPTQAALEQAICELEGGEAALALSSGMAAISVALLTLLKPGDQVVARDSLYATADTFLTEMLGPFGINVVRVDTTDPTSFAKAISPQTRVLYLESPTNPTMKLIDITAVVEIARSRKVTTIIENTFATPFNQRPLPLGVDLVIHSATKVPQRPRGCDSWRHRRLKRNRSAGTLVYQ